MVMLLVPGVTWFGAMKSSKLFRKTDMSQSVCSLCLASVVLIIGSTCDSNPYCSLENNYTFAWRPHRASLD